MSEQRDLFGQPYYPNRPGYVRGADTSHDAADSLNDSVLSRLRAQILGWINGHRDRGATCDEVEADLRLIHQTASARIRELVLMGRLYDRAPAANPLRANGAGLLRQTADTMTDPPARYFSLLLVAKDTNADPEIGLRHILKLALRRYGLKCVEARELGQPVSGEKPKIPVA